MLLRIFVLLICVFINIPSAEAGYADAILALKNKDYKTAMHRFIPLAKTGDAKSQIMLAYMYDKGIGIPQDDDKALEWANKAAEQGNLDAQKLLFEKYHYGRGVEQDSVKASEWLEKAALQNDLESQFKLAERYRDGMGVDQNNEIAVSWYNKAARQGHGKSQYALAKAYYSGTGVEKDLKAAYMWAIFAHIVGEKDAGTLKDHIMSKLTPKERFETEEMAIKWMKENR